MIKNHKLALAISDSGWSELIRQLDYKCLWYGRNLVKIDQWSFTAGWMSRAVNSTRSRKLRYNLGIITVFTKSIFYWV